MVTTEDVEIRRWRGFWKWQRKGVLRIKVYPAGFDEVPTFLTAGFLMWLFHWGCLVILDLNFVRSATLLVETFGFVGIYIILTWFSSWATPI